MVHKQRQLQCGKIRGRVPAFSLVELVIVIVIIGLLAAIAVPRFQQGASGADSAALTSNLRTLREALELYKVEHGKYPDDKSTIEAQLTQFSDIDGNTSATKGGDFVYGPYISKIPALPVGDNAGKTGIVDSGLPGAVATAGWWYNKSTGELRANLANDQVDAKGGRFNLK